MTIPGLLFDGQSSRASEATLRREGEMAVLQYDQKIVHVPLADVKVLSRLGSAPRAIEFPGLVRFESSYHEQIDRMFGVSSSFLHKLESNWNLVLASIVTFAVFCLACYLWIIPWTARAVVKKIPQTLIDKMADKMEGSWGLGVDVVLKQHEQDKLDVVVTRLANHFPGQRLNIRAVDLGENVANAFALPDGSMLVTESLLRDLSTNEILAVMMHEMGHVTLRHGLQALAGRMIVSAVMFITFGNTNVSNLGQMMVGLSYSRDSEREADRFAAVELKKDGLKPVLLADALHSIERSNRIGGARESSKIPNILSTHPMTEERVQYLRELSRP